MEEKQYFDLTNTENDIDSLAITQKDIFNCVLIHLTSGEIYSGFILAKSPAGNKLTICDVDFQRSGTDGKYQPRLIFRRTTQNLKDTPTRSNTTNVRISFQTGEDGYRKFWKMVFFLYRFKETIDFGEFEGTYQVLSSEELTSYLNNKDNYEKIEESAKELSVEVSTVIRSATTLKILKEYRTKLLEFIENDHNETDVQNWLDEDNHSYRRQRCMIFGLEFIDFKREGSSSSKRFDILTRVGSKNLENVLIELKSPSDSIFSVSSSSTNNNETHDYKIHQELSRAIPQILEYKSILESKPPGDPELEKVGIEGEARISKCIIIIGKNKDDPRWQTNRANLTKSFNSSLEVWTYSDLLNKLDSTIENLESNIGQEDL